MCQQIGIKKAKNHTDEDINTLRDEPKKLEAVRNKNLGIEELGRMTAHLVKTRIFSII